MGKTIAEKILGKAAGREVTPGEYIEVSSRRPVTIHGVMGGRNTAELKLIGTKLFDPKMVRVVLGGHVGAASAPAGSHSADGIAAAKKWAEEVGIPKDSVYDRQGIEHVCAGERCWALPGEIFFQTVNGHTSTLGALGAFAVTLSYGSAAYLLTGRTWMKVPETVRFNITGKLVTGVMARDVFEHVLGQIGPAGAPGQVMEWTGPTIEAIEMAGRFSLCCHALFTGAWTGIVNPDQKTVDYVRARTKEPFECQVSDPDAKYAKTYNYDVSGLVPLVASPPHRHTIGPASALGDVKINRGFIGTCSNGYLDDLRIAARILKGRRIHPDVQLNITPGSAKILLQALREGLIETFVEAGAIVPTPACGMCLGMNTPLGTGEVCIASATCNYPGRSGSREAQIYLGSSATVAASCIEGRITDPRQYL